MIELLSDFTKTVSGSQIGLSLFLPESLAALNEVFYSTSVPFECFVFFFCSEKEAGLEFQAGWWAMEGGTTYFHACLVF